MKPNFALDLSHDGIGLVHRGKGGWALVGEVSLAHPQLASGLDLLRRKAADLESGGFSCKLIIPDSQLLFTSMTAPGPDDTTRMAQIREGLEGLTPYNVEDLVFDWKPDQNEAGMVHVAVVARETLDEAVAFANDHKLNPVSLVARPSGNFLGEAFFGPIVGAVLSNGTTIERDSSPVPNLLGAVPSNEATPEPEEVPTPKPAAPKLPDLAPFPPTLDDPTPETVIADATPTVDTDEPPLNLTAASRTDTPPVVPEASKAKNTTPATPKGDDIVTGIVPPPPPPLPTTDEASPTPAFSSRRVDTVADTPATDRATTDPVEIDIKPRLSFGVDRGSEDGKAQAKTETIEPPEKSTVHVPVTAPTAFGEDPALKPEKSKPGPKSRKGDEKSAEKLSAAARKGAAGIAAAADAAGTIGRKAARKIEDRRKEKSETPKEARPKLALANLRNRKSRTADEASVTAVAPPPPHMTGGEKPQKTRRSREAESLTVFGARQTQQVGGKPKYLGLFLVLGLLLLMGIVVVWSTFFLKDSTAWLFPDRQDQFEAAISNDGILDTDQAAIDDVGEELSDTTDQTVDTDITLDRNPLTPEAAQARYAATGIWQRAPEPMADPEGNKLDDLYIASIDPETTGQDAVALPAPAIANNTNGEISTSAPPPLGTTFALDGDGLVIATREGALTPEGVVVYAGRPALVPAPRPGGTVDVADPVVEETVDAAPEQPRIRPRARPEGLVEGNERLQLGGRTRTELATLRPRARPTSVRATEQAAAITAALEAENDEAGNPSTAAVIAPTKLAIAKSIEPRHRPKGFNKIVARTLEKANASDGSVVVAAASPRQTVVPKIPTRASVAKQATIKNAINLRKVSLIGIYGSASARRALVRMPNGRYVKVGAGSRLDGGKVLSISTSQLVYKKGSRSITLKVLPFS